MVSVDLTLKHVGPPGQQVLRYQCDGKYPSKSALSPGAIFIITCATLLSGFAPAESLQAPQPPAIAPLIAEEYPNDSDRDRIEDELANKALNALAAAKAAANAEQQAAAQAAVAKTVDVELVFKQPITQAQINVFTALGGEITYIYKAVSYGWNGRLPLGKVGEVPAAMGETLVLVQEPKQVSFALLESTRTGRVRPIWAPGFAESVSGFEGDTNITIAILDSCVDNTHPDLAGRRVYWRNFSDEPAQGTGLVGFHGTMVAGVALGTGAASGSGTGTLLLTQARDLSGLTNGQFLPMPMAFPTGEVTLTITGRWNGGGSTTMAFASYDKGNLLTNPWVIVPNQINGLTNLSEAFGLSPLTLTCTVTGDLTRVYTPRLEGNGSASQFVVTCQISNCLGPADGFNRLRGVAPGCNWANAKIGRDDNTGQSSWISAAIDDVANQRSALNVKVMNLSLVVNDLTVRQKVNSAVNLGIVVTVAAGNGGLETGFWREIRDPGRAAFALTVGAANDGSELTYYTSHGFTPTYLSGPYAEDYKPDLMAPSGGRGTLVMAPDSNANDNPFPDQQSNDYLSGAGTSCASPFAAGCAALVIDAMHKQGIQWDFTSGRHAMLVKMLLCATATESNLPRETTNYNPTLQRAANGPSGFPAGKDPYEGYGMINPDAAVEAVSLVCTNGLAYNGSLGPTATDRRAWARTVNLPAGQLFYANLTMPPTGDFDLYLYSSQPGTNGNPRILASSTQAGAGLNEELNYLPPTNSTGIIVVKRVSGAGEFSLLGDVAPPPLLASPNLDGTDLILSFQTVAGRTYSIEYKEFLNDPAWQQLGSVPGDGDLMRVTNSISAAQQRFYRLRVQ